MRSGRRRRAVKVGANFADSLPRSAFTWLGLTMRGGNLQTLDASVQLLTRTEDVHTVIAWTLFETESL